MREQSSSPQSHTQVRKAAAGPRLKLFQRVPRDARGQLRVTEGGHIKGQGLRETEQETLLNRAIGTVQEQCRHSQRQ